MTALVQALLTFLVSCLQNVALNFFYRLLVNCMCFQALFLKGVYAFSFKMVVSFAFPSSLATAADVSFSQIEVASKMLAHAASLSTCLVGGTTNPYPMTTVTRSIDAKFLNI
jgi:hypothetical protein